MEKREEEEGRRRGRKRQYQRVAEEEGEVTATARRGGGGGRGGSERSGSSRQYRAGQGRTSGLVGGLPLLLLCLFFCGVTEASGCAAWRGGAPSSWRGRPILSRHLLWAAFLRSVAAIFSWTSVRLRGPGAPRLPLIIFAVRSWWRAPPPLGFESCALEALAAPDSAVGKRGPGLMRKNCVMGVWLSSSRICLRRRSALLTSRSGVQMATWLSSPCGAA